MKADIAPESGHDPGCPPLPCSDLPVNAVVHFGVLWVELSTPR